MNGQRREFRFAAALDAPISTRIRSYCQALEHGARPISTVHDCTAAFPERLADGDCWVNCDPKRGLSREQET
jgi:hypothetical protein